MADIFISYKREDKEKAELLANKLMTSGWSVWWDHDLLGGDDYDVVIERELTKTKAVIVIWSALSVQSRNVKDEAKKGLNHNILIPVSFDNTEPPIGFGMTHVIIFDNRTTLSQDEYVKLYESVKNKAGLPGNPGSPPAPVKKDSMTGWIALGLTVLLIISILVVRRFQNQNRAIDSGYLQRDTAKPVSPQEDISTKKAPSEREEVVNFFKSMRPVESTLPGDSIIYYRFKQITNNSVTLNVDYSYNTQHGGQVFLGAWLWKSANAGGYQPVILSSASGTAEITISLSDLKEPISSKGILLFMSEQYKGPFSYRVFEYLHTWNP